MQQVEEAKGPPVRWTRKVSAAIKLTLHGNQEELQLIEGWCAIGCLEEIMRKRGVMAGAQVSSVDLVRVGLFAKDKTLGTNMFLTLNWRGGWWIKENPDWGRVVTNEELPVTAPPLPGPVEAPNAEEPWAEMTEQPYTSVREVWRRNGWVTRRTQATAPWQDAWREWNQRHQ